MGRIFRLSEKKEYLKETISLIEESLSYENQFQFSIDFAPLIDQSNLHNCYILLNEDQKVIGHIGTREKLMTFPQSETKKKVSPHRFPVTLIGGVCIHKNFRGKGYFQELFNHVIAEKKYDSTFFMLWSDLESVYKKFGFYLCGTQYETTREMLYSESEFISETLTFQKTKYHLLSSKTKNQIQHLYNSSFRSHHLTFERSQSEWTLIEKMTSVDLFIREKNNQIVDYFFMNKGQDLQNIIFEYGSIKNKHLLLKEICHYGKIWSSFPVHRDSQKQFQFFLSPGNPHFFFQFVQCFTQNKISPTSLNLIKNDIHFIFENKSLSLSLDQFLQGLFGPSTFEDLELPQFFVSGNDSV